MFFFAGGYFVVLYFLPIYFQSVYNASPISSGVKMLALILPLTFAAIAQGIALSKIGIAPLFWIGGGTLATIGCGLFYTMDAHTSVGKWIGYQIIVGFASGITFQTAAAVAQVHATAEDMSQVTAVIFCEFHGSMYKLILLLIQSLVFQMIGGSFFVSAAQSAFNNRLITVLASTAPEINPARVLGTGATQIRSAFTAEQVPLVVDAYMSGLKSVFAITIAGFGISAFIGFLGSWKRLHGDGLKPTVAVA
jgi:MFS transporter, DHA2 family, glioxin efflux transporter